MKIRTFGIVALLATSILTIAGCGKTQTPVENPDENVEMANPASVYCEKQGGTLVPQVDVEGNAYIFCALEDGEVCEEWAYYNGDCPSTEEDIDNDESNNDAEPENNNSSELYSEEDILAAQNAIMNVINNEWNVRVESVELTYAGDEESAANLDYCKELANAQGKDVDECAVFTSSFYIPAQDAQMAGAFEPDTTLTGYDWTLGRATAGEWEVLTNGFG